MRLAFILSLFSFVCFSNENDLILKYNQCKKLSGKDLSLCSLEYGNLYTLNYTGKKYSNDDEAIKDIMKKEIGYYVFYCEKQSEGLFKPLSVLKKECDSRLPNYIDYATDNLSPQQDRNLLIIACNKMKSTSVIFNCKELKTFENLVILEYQKRNVDEYPLPYYIKKMIKESIENKDFMQK